MSKKQVPEKEVRAYHGTQEVACRQVVAIKLPVWISPNKRGHPSFRACMNTYELSSSFMWPMLDTIWVPCALFGNATWGSKIAHIIPQTPRNLTNISSQYLSSLYISFTKKIFLCISQRKRLLQTQTKNLYKNRFKRKMTFKTPSLIFFCPALCLLYLISIIK